MFYPVDPIEYSRTVDAMVKSGEITAEQGSRMRLDNYANIDRVHADRVRALELDRTRAAARGQQQLSGSQTAGERARMIWEQGAEARARIDAADRADRQQTLSRRISSQRDMSRGDSSPSPSPPSSALRSVPSGMGNGSSSSNGIDRPVNRNGPGASSRAPSSSSPSSKFSGNRVGGPVTGNGPVWSGWANGQTSGGQATRGQPPVSAPSGTPPRPTPFAPNYRPAMGGGAGAGAAAAIGGAIGGIILSPDFWKNPKSVLPEWLGGPKIEDPFIEQQKTAKRQADEIRKAFPWLPWAPDRKSGRNAPDPDPNDPYRDPNRPDPSNIPLGPLPGPEYPPGVIGQWMFRVSYYGEWGGYVSRVGTSEVKPVDRIVDGNRQVRLGESVLFNGSVNGPSGVEYFFQPDDPTVKKLPSERPDSEPENLPDPTAPPSPEYSPDKTPAPGVSPSPSSVPEGSPAPSGSPNGSSLPGGDRAPRPELSSDTEKKPGLSPGFVPGFRPDFEPEPSSTPKPKPGMQPQNDPKTDPRKRDLRYFEPSTGTGTTPGTGTGTTPGTGTATGTTPGTGTATGTTPGTGTGTGTTSPPLLCRYPIASSITIGIFDGFDENGNPKTKNESVTCLPSESARVQLLFRRLFKLESTVFDGQVAIPEAWAVRVGTDRPQLVIVYAELLPSGKLGRSRWSLSVPHYNRGEKASISAPSYRRGTWVGRLALNDGSSLNVNAASSAECKRAINKLKILVPNSFRVNASGKASKPRIAENPDLDFKEVNVVPVTAKFFATGQKTLSPTWNKKLRKST